MKLAAIAGTSRRLAETARRGEKIGLLAAALAEAPPEEIEIATAYLSGAVRQDRLGLGWATIQKAMPETAAESATVELAEVHAVLEAIANSSGKGSAQAKQRLLRDLLARLTAEEQRFLAGLLVGELRQGALEGLVIEAVARAAGRPAAEVRRAFMIAGDLPSVAGAALGGGPPGIGIVGIRGAASSSRCCRCWPAAPRTWIRRSPSWARPRWSTSSTARGSRSIGAATTSGSTPADSTR